MTRTLNFIAAICLTAFALPAFAATQLDQRVDAATEVLQQLTQIPEQGIPPALLKNAYAVAVIPNTIKAGFMIGGTYGRGILTVRQSDGSWSNPSFIMLGGGSLGFQIGGQASDIVLVFKTRQGVENIASGKVTLGGELALTAGPVGRYTKAATDATLKSEIYTYARSRGFFGGVSLEGAWLRMDDKANYLYYESGQGTAANILADDHIPTPAHARRFIEVLASVTPSLNGFGEPKRTAALSTPRREEPQTGAKTFAIDDAPPVNDDGLGDDLIY